MSLTQLIFSGVCILIVLVLVGKYGETIDKMVNRYRSRKMMRRENARPLLIMNGGIHDKVGRIRVAVWGSDFFAFAAAQAKAGSVGMFYAPKTSPAAVFTDTGYMPDGRAASGDLNKLEKILKALGSLVRCEYRSDLFVPGLSDLYGDEAWQIKRCGIVREDNLYLFMKRYFDLMPDQTK